MHTPDAPQESLPRTLGELKERGYRTRSLREELRANLVTALGRDQPLFPEVVGYDKTVVPQVVNALLSGHDFILLGLRGQAKTRMAFALAEFLDEWLPFVKGAPLRGDPLGPYLEPDVRERAAELGDDLAIDWLHRSQRIQEKLATPDITMADLIGDIDPIKAANERRSLMDPEVIQYGLVPRTNRGIFIINELPDLPTRIQVGLFNLLEEKSLQVRGFPLRLPLDVLFVFTANPEDYTNRGNIVTPLRDRIRSQIHTHYPARLEDALEITRREARVSDRLRGPSIRIPQFMREAVEETAIQARTSSFVDQSSGVSARVSISLLENMVSNAERRALQKGEAEACARPADLYAALPGLAGKIELVFEGEQEGTLPVCRQLIGRGLKAVFDRYLEDPYRESGKPTPHRYDAVLGHFKNGHQVQLSADDPDSRARAALSAVPGLLDLARSRLALADPAEEVAGMELVLEGLHQASLVAKRLEPAGAEYRDQMDEMMEGLRGD